MTHRVPVSERLAVNIGEDDAVQAEMTDTVPLGTNYVPGSLTINGTTASDAADGDPGDVVDRRVRATVGTPGPLGGRLPPGSTTRVVFQVEITPDNLDGASILNVAGFSYMGGQTGAEIGGTSNITQTPYTGPRADLSVTKVAQPPLVQRDGTREVSYQLVVINNGPKDEPAATLTDTLPAGFTDPAVDDPDCDLTGLTVTCDIGLLTVGASAVVTVTGTLPADTPDPTANTATVSGSPGSVDPNPDNNTATALVEVNTPPAPVNDTASVPPGVTSVTVPVLPNDSDPDGDPITVTTAIVQPPANGSVVVNEDGTLTYTSTNPTFKGTDSVTYEICDDRGGCDTATVTITVPNKPPVATNDSTGTPAGVSVNIDVRANDTDPNGDPLGPPTITSPPSSGIVSVNANGTVTYTPLDTPPGTTVTFDYQVCDIATPQECDTATVTVAVSNTAPVAVDDFYETDFDTPRTFLPTELLGNDSDPDVGQVLDIQSVQDPQNGTVELNDNGTVTFTPDPGFVGRPALPTRLSTRAGKPAPQRSTSMCPIPHRQQPMTRRRHHQAASSPSRSSPTTPTPKRRAR